MNAQKLFFMLIAALCLLLVACNSAPTVTYYPDTRGGGSELVAEQAATIEEQRVILEDMGRIVNEVLLDLRNSRNTVEGIIETTDDLRELFGSIDSFVRELIEIERRLEDIQRTNS